MHALSDIQFLVGLFNLQKCKSRFDISTSRVWLKKSNGSENKKFITIEMEAIIFVFSQRSINMNEKIFAIARGKRKSEKKMYKERSEILWQLITYWIPPDLGLVKQSDMNRTCGFIFRFITSLCCAICHVISRIKFRLFNGAN